MAARAGAAFTAMTKRFLLLVLLLAAPLLQNCGDEVPVVDIPPAIVNVQINLNNFEYQPLQVDGGWVYEPGGVRGLIIYRQSASRYRAFERNCTFEPRSSCARVEVDPSNLFISDPCCSSIFSLPDGIPTGGPAPAPLREYRTFLDANFLYVQN